MLTINKHLSQGQGLAPALLRRATTLELDWDTRQKSRFDAVDSTGRALGVFLPRGTAVRGGDVLVAEDGSLIRVAALPQPVLVVRSCPARGSSFDLMRAAYHLGNRHVALELQPDRLQFEPDPVLADMLRRMHLIVSEANAPFEPETGAYDVGARHGHSDGHEHHHKHHHAHDHSLADGQGAEHGHVDTATPGSTEIKAAGDDLKPGPPVAHRHGPGCGHAH